MPLAVSGLDGLGSGWMKLRVLVTGTTGPHGLCLWEAAQQPTGYVSRNVLRRRVRFPRRHEWFESRRGLVLRRRV